MTEFLVDWVCAAWEVLVLSGPWLLIGFALAGLLRIVVPDQLVHRFLGKNNYRSVLTAALAGIPIPLCSCSVLPTAIALRKSGASKGATTSFLVSTPETGVDSIGVTWALMDPIMTIVRPLAALVTAVVSGLLVNLLVKVGLAKDGPADCEDSFKPEVHDHDHAHSHEHHHPSPQESGGNMFVRALRYAFGPLLDDLTAWFIVGLALSGLIAVLVPDGFFASTGDSRWLNMFAMLIVGIPMYVCATASTPIAAALIAKGLDPGAALVFLLAGPATNLATLAVVRSFLGGQVLVAYLSGIAVCSVLCGALLGPLYGLLGSDVGASRAGIPADGSGWFQVAAAVLVLYLLALSARRLRLHVVWAHTIGRLLARIGVNTASPVFRTLAALAVLLTYLSSSFGQVRVGETGFLIRFGEVVEVCTTPGLLVHLPYPIEKLECLRTEEIRGAGVGAPDVELDEDNTVLEATEVAEVATGDEGLLKVQFAVNYMTADPYRYRFATRDPVELVVALSVAALQRTVSGRTTNEILVADRQALALDIARCLEEEVRAVDLGLRIVAVRIGSIHAPAQVHDAFRSVASALEDKVRYEHDAEGYRIRNLTMARGIATKTVEEARGQAVSVVKESQGRAEAFRAFAGAYREGPHATSLRLQLDTLHQRLRGARVVFQLGEGVEVVDVPPIDLDDY